MKNNSLDKITMVSSKRKRALQPLSHDVQTTFGFGELQPLFCHEIQPDSKFVIQQESLVRLAPMNVPTFGRLKLKAYGQFVPTVDIFPCHNELMAQTRFTYGSTTYVPKYKPMIKYGVLSAMCLAGADCSLYVRVLRGAGLETWECPNENYYNSNFKAAFESRFGGSWWQGLTYSGEWFDGQYFHGLDLGVVLGDKINSPITGHYLPIKMQVLSDLLDGSGGAVGQAAVKFGRCDYTVCHSFDYNGQTYHFALCFNLNAFGKRLRKFIIGSGSNIDTNSITNISLLPLMASYKAYFDLFNLPQWMNFEDTALKKFINVCIQQQINGPVDVNSYFYPSFTQWMAECGSAWYTAPQDYYSAHQANVSNSSSYFGLDSFRDVSAYPQPSGNTDGAAPGSPNDVNTYSRLRDSFTANESDFLKNPHARLQTSVHGQLDSELLKRLYKWTNRNSVIGQRVAELLRAQGLGDYVDSEKSNYVGSFEVPIQISDVVSMTDSYQPATENGKVLGAYGAKGLGYNKSDTFVYETKEHGFMVILGVVIPDSGFGMGVDPSIFAIDKESSYNPEFDALGMEASRKMIICGTEVSTADASENSSLGDIDATHGFVPRYSGLKVINNKMNGDFSLYSMRENYTPYTLDKLIYLNDKDFDSEASDGSNGTKVTVRYYDFGAKQMPTAGNAWRYPTRYGWLGHLHRIFALVGNNEKNKYGVWDGIQQEVLQPYFDNFIVQTVFNIRNYTPMLPMEDSFETHDDGNEGVTNMAVSKA